MRAKTYTQPIYRSPSGFTLVELLVVITIIVVLAGVGFPTITKMRASAARTQCMEQLRGWGVAMGGYAADHDGKIEWRNWYPITWDKDESGKEKASPYVHYWTGGTIDVDNRSDDGAFGTQLKMRACPAVKYKIMPGVNSPVSYAMIRPTENGVVVPTTNGSTYPLSKISRPSRFILMIDAISGNLNPLTSSGDFTAKVKPLTMKGDTLRHNGTVNSLMGDFSVRSMTWKQIEKDLAYWTAL